MDDGMSFEVRDYPEVNACDALVGAFVREECGQDGEVCELCGGCFCLALHFRLHDCGEEGDWNA